MKNHIRLLPWIFLLLLGSVVFVWFSGDFLVNPGDFNFSFNPPQDLYRSLFLWDHFQSMGVMDSMAVFKVFPYNILLAGLYSLGLTLSTCLKVLFFLLITISSTSAYTLIRHFFPAREHLMAAFIGANFYTFNTYLMQFGWGSGYIMGMFFYAAFPLIIFFWHKVKESGESKHIIGFVFALSLSLPSLNNPVYLVPLLVYIVLDSVFTFSGLTGSSAKQRFSMYAKVILFTSITFSLLLYALSTTFLYSLANVAVSSEIFGQLNTNSSQSNILNLFRGLGDWAFYVSHEGSAYYPYAHVYLSPPFVVLTLFIPFVAGLAYILDKDNHRKRFILFIFALYLLGIFLSKGVHGPFGEWYGEWFSLVRNPLEKFGKLLPLALSILITYGLVVLLGTLKRRRSLLLILSLIVVNLAAYPMWTGGLWREQKLPLPGFKFELPENFYDLKNFLDNKELDYRVIQLPENNVPIPGLSSSTYKGINYNGPDPLGRLLAKPVFFIEPFVYSMPSSAISSQMFLELRNQPGEFLSSIDEYAALLNARYILIRKDAERNHLYGPKTQFSLLEKYLVGKNNIRIGEFILRPVPDPHFTPLVTAAEDITEYTGDFFDTFHSLNDIQRRRLFLEHSWKTRAPVSLSTPVLEYRRINPTKIRVRLHGASGAVALVFHENFFPGWKLMLGTASKLSASEIQETLPHYRVLSGNEKDQASQSEFRDYLEKGWLSATGKMAEKEKSHYSYERTARINVSREAFVVPFVSKLFKGSVQNEGLAQGSMFESVSLQSLTGFAEHVKGNHYANAWLIDTEKISKAFPELVIRNNDGSYELEFVIEFTQQRTFLMFSILSLISFVLLFVVVGLRALKFKKDGNSVDLDKGANQ